MTNILYMPGCESARHRTRTSFDGYSEEMERRIANARIRAEVLQDEGHWVEAQSEIERADTLTEALRIYISWSL